MLFLLPVFKSISYHSLGLQEHRYFQNVDVRMHHSLTVSFPIECLTFSVQQKCLLEVELVLWYLDGSRNMSLSHRIFYYQNTWQFINLITLIRVLVMFHDICMFSGPKDPQTPCGRPLDTELPSFFANIPSICGNKLVICWGSFSRKDQFQASVKCQE